MLAKPSTGTAMCASSLEARDLHYILLCRGLDRGDPACPVSVAHMMVRVV